VAEVNAEDLDAIRHRRQWVRAHEMHWTSSASPSFVSTLLDNALASSEDIDALMEALRLARGGLPR